MFSFGVFNVVFLIKTKAELFQSYFSFISFFADLFGESYECFGKANCLASSPVFLFCGAFFYHYFSFVFPEMYISYLIIIIITLFLPKKESI